MKKNINLFIFIHIISCYMVKAQENNFCIELQAVVLVKSYPMALLCYEEKSYQFDHINFAFKVINNTKSDYAFSSFTKNHYRQGYELPFISTNNEPLYGQFYLINEKDTFSLYTTDNFMIYESQEEAWIWPKLDIIDIPVKYNLNKLLCRFPNDKKKYQEAFYNYIKESTFIYVPEPKDYKNELINQKLTKIIYPMDTLYIKKIDKLPFFYHEQDIEDDKNYEIYYGK